MARETGERKPPSVLTSGREREIITVKARRCPVRFRASHVLIEAVPMTPKEWADGESLIADFAREGEVIPA